MKIENWSLGKIKPYHQNAKLHNIEWITKSIEEFKVDQPIVVDGDGVIIKGHGRLEAAQRLGLKTFPVIVRTDLTPEQVRLARIADNRSAEAGWDTEALELELSELDMSAFDFDVAELGVSDEWLAELGVESGEDAIESDPADDEIPEVEESTVKSGDIWQLGNHRLMCGDSTSADDVGRLMDGDKADMVFTDPPYGVSYANKNSFLNSIDKGNSIQTEIKNDHMSLSQTGELWAKTFTTWAQYHNQYSSYYICAPQGGDLFLMMMMMNENNHPLRHTIIWAKNNHVLGRADYNYKHEPILYGWQHKHKFYGNGDQKFSVWNYDKPLKNDLHPTMKPVNIVVNAILNSTNTGMSVADYFLGSGTTLIACEKTNRICYGMEIDPHYCDVIIKRWEDFTGQQAVKL